MRKVAISKILILVALLLMLAVICNRTEPKISQTHKPSLDTALDNLSGWTASSPISMGTKIEDALNLDDYLFRTYFNGKNTVSLYIGYYRSAAKIGSAHDPLVCFTGQGWRIVERGGGTYQLSGSDKQKIYYSTMIAEQQSEKEYVLYWFQTNGTTSAGTFAQKRQMILQRFSNNPKEENAFVRLSTKMDGIYAEDAKKRILNFVDTFYPEFYRYVGE